MGTSTGNFGFDQAVSLVDRARNFGDVVAGLQSQGAITAAGGGAAGSYRLLVKLIHPDAVSAGRAATATETFAKLSQLWARRDESGRARSGGNTLRVGVKVHAGDIADLFVDDDGRKVLVKVPRAPADNDLMTAERDALRRLREHGDPKYRAYAPRLVESFVHEDPRRCRRQVNVVERLAGMVPLTEVEGLDWRDATWVWRRLLVALGWAHRAGVVHGAVFEEHVLIHPAEHGLALVDWCYAGEKPLVMIKGKAYPPEIQQKRQTAATDIWLATALMKRLVQDMPPALRRFADGCLYDNPRMRPQDAWRLLQELDELLGI